MEAEPDVYFKVFGWRDNQFYSTGHVTPEVFEKVETKGGKIVLEIGGEEL